MINEFETIQIVEHLRKLGVTNYTMRPGNGCVWVSYGRINSYYIFSNGLLQEVQYD